MLGKKLNWIRYKDRRWCKLNSVNLCDPHFERRNGIYIVWHGGKEASVLYIGHGNIREQIKLCRNNSEIQKYEDLGLFVTWATVQEMDQDGIMSHLIDKWSPKIRDDNNIPKASSIQVNSPW